jgi:autotransporter-associated beta strand protein
MVRSTLSGTLLLLTGLSAHAQTGTWTQATAGTYNWSTAANWQGGTVADGAGNTANFTTASLTGPIVVTLDTNRTIGSLVFDNPTNTFSWSLTGTTTLTLNTTTGTPSIAVNNANISAGVGVTLAGTQGFTKAGPGTLNLTGNNTLTGGINVSAGVLSLSRTATINPLGTNALTLSGGTLTIGAANASISPIALAASSYNQAMVVPVGATDIPGSVTASMDGGTAKTGNTWYAVGQNTASPTTGLPMGTTFTSQSNANTRYTLLPAATGSNEAMMLDGAATSGRLTLTTPARFSTLSFLTSSGNGAGSVTATVNFSDGTASVALPAFSSPDWFNATPVAVNASGRIDLGSLTYNNVGAANPNLYEEDVTLPASAAAHPIASVDLAWTGGANTHTAIFGLSGAAVGVPQTFTNTVAVTANSTITVSDPNGVVLGNLSIGTNTLNVTGGAAGAKLTLGAATLTGNPTFNNDTTTAVTLGALNDGGTARTITKAGAGTLTLGSAATSLVAGTQVAVTGGTLASNNATALGNAAQVSVTGGTFSVGASQTLAALSGTGGTVALNGNTLTVNGSQSTTFAGSIADGSAAGALVKAGTGTLALTGGSSFSGGVTLTGGTLSSSAPGRLGTGTATLAGGGVLVIGGLPAGSGNVTGFGGNGTGWTLNSTAGNPTGVPGIASDLLTITTNANGEASSVWNNTKVPVSQNFTVKYTYQATNGSGNPADGVTFTLQNDTRGTAAVGGGGGALGYVGVTPSGAFAINIYNPNTRGIAVTAGGAQPPAPYLTVGSVNLLNPTTPSSGGNPIDVTLVYDAGAATLTASLAEETTTNTFTQVFTGINLATVTGGTTAFMGFTGATGGENATQQISNFSFTQPAQATYTNAVNVPNLAGATIAVAAPAGVSNITLGALAIGSGSLLNVTADASTPANQAYGLTFGATTLNGPATFSVANNGTGAGTVTLGAVGGSGSLSKGGPGTLVLANPGTYTGGTAVNAGRLLVTNTTGSATGTGAVAVNAGGILGGTGTVGGAVTVNGSGVIIPGVSGPGILTVTGGVTFSDGGVFAPRLNGTTAGTGYSQLASAGAINLGAGVVSLVTSLGYAPAASDSLTIITTTGALSGTFAGLPNNASVFVGSFSGQLYDATVRYSANSVVLTSFTPVPEPGYVLLACGTAAGLAGWWSRRRKAGREAYPDSVVC